VRKVIRSEATEFHYERGRQPLPRIDPWRDQLDGLLLANEGKAARERLTPIRMFEELRGLGYEGSYDAVRRYAKKWRVERGAATAEAYVPLSFAPGEAYQFDWSHEVVLINGTTVTVKVAHVRLCHSRMLFVRAYPRETQEMVFDAHIRAFVLFKGACTRGIYDNMPAARATRGGRRTPPATGQVARRVEIAPAGLSARHKRFHLPRQHCLSGVRRARHVGPPYTPR
jgi:transposase